MTVIYATDPGCGPCLDRPAAIRTEDRRMVMVLAVFAVRAVGGIPGALESRLAEHVSPSGRRTWLSRRIGPAVVHDVPGLHQRELVGELVSGRRTGRWRLRGSTHLLGKEREQTSSLAATLWFNIAHYALRPWPWILTAPGRGHHIPGSRKIPNRLASA